MYLASSEGGFKYRDWISQNRTSWCAAVSTESPALTSPIESESGLPRVLRGGTTEVDITIDASGFPVKAAYSGDDMELTSDVPDYMLENMAASQLTAYYKPIALPENLQK